MKKRIEAIDLFCGVGGLTYGLQQAKINVLAGLDNDSSCAFAYEKNNKAKFISADVSKYDFTEMKKFYSKDSIKILVGCAPCQPFSSHTFKSKNKEEDTRWNLIDYFIEAIKVLNPEVVSMENVRGITKTDVFLCFVKKLEKMKYKVSYDVLYCPDYGIPQSRSRLVLLASRLGEIQVPKKTHKKHEYKTVKDVIGSLPPLKSGEKYYNDPTHRTKSLSSLNLARIRQSKPNGTWKDWDKKLLPDCYKKLTGQTYTSVYGRMAWNDVSPTITTQFASYGTGRFGHPEQHRALSIREGALLQTFPPKYDFGNQIKLTQVARHIGNAVPPQLGYVIGKAIKNHIGECYVN